MSASNLLVRAVMAEADTPLATVQGCGSVRNDECFVLIDRYTGRPLRQRRYRIEGSGTVVEGVTDGEGRTARVDTGAKAEKLHIYLLDDDPEGEVEGDECDPCM